VRELLVAQLGLKVDDDVFLLLREHSTLQPGPQVVDPTQAAALAISLETFEKASPYKNKRRKNSQKHMMVEFGAENMDEAKFGPFHLIVRGKY
jgi:hypothetical protein